MSKPSCETPASMTVKDDESMNYYVSTFSQSSNQWRGLYEPGTPDEKLFARAVMRATKATTVVRIARGSKDGVLVYDNYPLVEAVKRAGPLPEAPRKRRR